MRTTTPRTVLFSHIMGTFCSENRRNAEPHGFMQLSSMKDFSALIPDKYVLIKFIRECSFAKMLGFIRKDNTSLSVGHNEILLQRLVVYSS